MDEAIRKEAEVLLKIVQNSEDDYEAIEALEERLKSYSLNKVVLEKEMQ